MNYFINIVECGCNLSIAAKKIHISQSALSQFVTNFEAAEGIQLFNRKNGRLESLTEAGRKIYRFATESQKQRGTINLGIPSLILRTFFSNTLPHFLRNNPHIYIQVIEGGGKEIHQKMSDGDLNLAFLIEPTNLDAQKFEQHIIHLDEYVAYMDKHHPLAQKEALDWSDLADYDLAIFNKTFTTYDLVVEKLRSQCINTKFAYLSSTWDFLIESTYQTDLITILPKSVETLVDSSRFQTVRFNDPIPFNVWFCRPYKDSYNEVESYVYEELLKGYYQPLSEN